MVVRDITSGVDSLIELTNPQTFVDSELDPYSYFELDASALKTYNYFRERWTDEEDEQLKKLLWYCGSKVSNYSFDIFFTTFEIYQDAYLQLIDIDSDRDEFHKQIPNAFHFWHSLQSFLDIRATELRKSKKAEGINRIRKCKLSRETFDNKHFPQSISFSNRRIPQWEVLKYHLDIHPEKMDPFKRSGSDSDVFSTISNLRDLLDFLGFIPSKNVNIWNIYQNIPREKFITFINLASRAYYPIRYSNVFGSWLKAVIATGYLGPEGIAKGLFGYRVLAKDGHVCNSLIEKTIDDWLFDKSIPHEKEPRYPKIVTDYLSANVRADWKIGDTYVEFFGLQAKDTYAEKTTAKILAC